MEPTIVTEQLPKKVGNECWLLVIERSAIILTARGTTLCSDNFKESTCLFAPGRSW